MNSKEGRPRIILYLGAGASYFADYYTFVDFPELLFNVKLREAEGMPPLSPNSGRILGAIRSSLERNSIPTTHDNFLWRLDGYTQFLRLNQCDDALQDFLRENARLFDLHICTEQAIQQITASTIHHYSSNRVRRAKDVSVNGFAAMRKVIDLYSSIASLNGTGMNLDIFSTNYDMLIEDLIEEFGAQGDRPVTLANGIPGRTQELATWRHQEYPPENRNGCLLKLYRLHGCTCWFYHSQGDDNVYFHRRDATHQPGDRLCAMYPGRETHIGTGPHGHSFRRFYEQLQVCDLAVFIGFSFRDDDVMHVLLKALAERCGTLKILVVDRLYTKVDVRNKLADAAKRTTFPTRLPEDGEIDSLRMNFGMESDFDALILERCRTMLGKKKGD